MIFSLYPRACVLTLTCFTGGVTILLVSFSAAISSSYRPRIEFPRIIAISSSIFMPSFR